MSISKDDVDRWLGRYVAAWKSYEHDEIAALFSDDIEYRYHPNDAPVRGRDAVVKAWLGDTDEPEASSRDVPGTYDAEYRTIAVDGEVAVATGSSTYLDRPDGTVDRVYDNCFVMRFDDDGRCLEFTEWFIKRS